MFTSHSQALAAFADLKKQGLKIDMTRGKPGPDQLNKTDKLFELNTTRNYITKNKEDARNYGGGVAGIIEARELMAAIMEVDPKETIVHGNSSLKLMAEYLKFRILPEAQKIKNAKFLAPVPGYDRHYSMTKHFGIEMIPVPFNGDGPDMDMCEDLVRRDSSIMGIWCIPKFSNPSGHTYSAPTVERIAALPGLTKGLFQVMWDNAYAVHDLDTYAPLASIMAYAKKHGTADSIAIFASTSKITYAGAGLASIGLSEAQHAAYCKHLEFETIGPDKISQLRHVEALKDFNGVIEHMRAHAALLRPRFEAVTETLSEFVGNIKGVSFNRPGGGYFVDLRVPGIAKEVVALCAEAGVKLTPAGAAYPYGDPDNSQIRIAPSYPTPEENRLASQVIGTAISQLYLERSLIDI